MARDLPVSAQHRGEHSNAIAPALVSLRDKALRRLHSDTVIGLIVLSGILGLLLSLAGDVRLFPFVSLGLSAVLLPYWWGVYQRRNAHFAWHDHLELAVFAWLQRKGVPVGDLAMVRSSARLKEGPVSNALIVTWLVGGILGLLFWFAWQIQVASLAFGRTSFELRDLLVFPYPVVSLAGGVPAALVHGLLQLYLLKRVLDDLRFHERRENVFLRLASEKAARHGIELNVLLERRRSIGWRNFWLQLFVFPILTLGIYGLWVVHYVFQDGTSHAKHHGQWEESVLSALAKEGVTVGVAVPSPELSHVQPFATEQIMVWGDPKAEIESWSFTVQEAVSTTVPQASPPATSVPEERLRKLTRLREGGLITEDEYEAKRKEILKDL